MSRKDTLLVFLTLKNATMTYTFCFIFFVVDKGERDVLNTINYQQL
jgi:hypothetical protein